MNNTLQNKIEELVERSIGTFGEKAYDLKPILKEMADFAIQARDAELREKLPQLKEDWIEVCTALGFTEDSDRQAKMIRRVFAEWWTEAFKSLINPTNN